VRPLVISHGYGQVSVGGQEAGKGRAGGGQGTGRGRAGDGQGASGGAASHGRERADEATRLEGLHGAGPQPMHKPHKHTAMSAHASLAHIPLSRPSHVPL
jgi:hypothetical protein